jgi:hypothetical protein
MRFLFTTLAVALSLGMAGGVAAQQNAPGAPVTVTVTVAAKSPSVPPPAVPQNVVQVKQDGESRRVISWTPARAEQAGLDLAVLVDDSVTKDATVQLREIGDWIPTLPANAKVAVAYARNGGVYFTLNFTANHELGVNAFPIPNQYPDTGVGLYDSVVAMMQKFPADGNRHEILLISDGIDVTNGVSEAIPGVSQVLQHCINEAEHYGVVVHSIYAGGSGRLLHGQFIENNGQGSLNALASATGGEAFYEGVITPLSFKPFLQQLSRDLAQQYVLTFMPERKGSDYSRLKVAAELSGIRVIAPDHIYLGGATGASAGGM